MSRTVHTPTTHAAKPANPAHLVARGSQIEAQVVQWAVEHREIDKRMDALFTPSGAEAVPGAQATYEVLYRKLNDRESLILKAPCVSPRVAALKLQYGLVKSMTEGDRTDGLDVSAAQQVVAYLEKL